MKNWLSSFCIKGVLLMSVMGCAQAADTYTIDPLHSYVLYHINHLGFSTQTGKWFVNGKLTMDKANPKNSKVNVVIQMDSIDTGIAELDKHLKSGLFFDVKQFPTATFASDKIDVTGKTTGKIQGILTLHGVSKPITLEAKLAKLGVNEISNKMTAGFSAQTQLKRSDFNINTLLPAVGDEVTLDIQVEAYQSK